MTQKKAEILLAAVIAARATSLLFSKIAMNGMGIFNLLAARFLMAFVLLAVVFFKRLRHIKRHTLVRGAIMGGLFFLMLSTELTGLKSYPAGLTMTAARRVTDRFCQSAIQLVLDTDLAMKTSAGEQEQLLELLLVRLAQEAQHG